MTSLLRTAAVALTALTVSAPSVALADAAEAKSCIDSKIWSGYTDGWAVRTAVDSTMKKGQLRVYLVTLYAGNEYQFQACGDANAGDIDLVLHKEDGTEVKRDESDDREPHFSFKPTRTDTYYVSVVASTMAGEATEAGVAMAVTYK